MHKITCWDFNGNCTESIDQVGKNWHLDTESSPLHFIKGLSHNLWKHFHFFNFFLSEFFSLHFFIRVQLSLPQKALSDMVAQLFPFMCQHYVLDIMIIVKQNLLSETFIFLLHLAKSYWLFRPALGSVVRLATHFTLLLWGWAAQAWGRGMQGRLIYFSHAP